MKMERRKKAQSNLCLSWSACDISQSRQLTWIVDRSSEIHVTFGFDLVQPRRLRPNEMFWGRVTTGKLGRRRHHDHGRRRGRVAHRRWQLLQHHTVYFRQQPWSPFPETVTRNRFLFSSQRNVPLLGLQKSGTEIELATFSHRKNRRQYTSHIEASRETRGEWNPNQHMLLFTSSSCQSSDFFTNVPNHKFEWIFVWTILWGLDFNYKFTTTFFSVTKTVLGMTEFLIRAVWYLVFLADKRELIS